MTTVLTIIDDSTKEKNLVIKDDEAAKRIQTALIVDGLMVKREKLP